MFEQWQRLYEASREEGYKRFRVTEKKSLKDGAERFVEYEVKLDTALDKYPITVLCQYNTQLFHGGELTDLINAHPLVISNGQLLRNHFYDLLAEVGLSAGSLEIVTPRLKTELSRQVDALFLTAALVLATLPIRQKIEYSERLLARLIGQGKFHFCLGGLMCDSTILACHGSKTRNVCPCCSLRNNPDFISYEIKTTESFYGYLLLERSVDEACRALRPSLVNYLNLLASIENGKNSACRRSIFICNRRLFRGKKLKNYSERMMNGRPGSWKGRDGALGEQSAYRRD